MKNLNKNIIDTIIIFKAQEYKLFWETTYP